MLPATRHSRTACDPRAVTWWSPSKPTPAAIKENWHGRISSAHSAAEYSAEYSRLRLDQFHHRGRERFGFFLRKIVAGARDDPMIAAGSEFCRARRAIGRGGNAVPGAIQCDRRNR